MESLLAKIITNFKEYRCCMGDGEGTIIFRRAMCHHHGIKFDLKVFIEKLDKLIQETPEIQKRPHVEIHYRMIDNDKHFNMFGIEIPHIIDTSMDLNQNWM